VRVAIFKFFFFGNKCLGAKMNFFFHIDNKILRRLKKPSYVPLQISLKNHIATVLLKLSQYKCRKVHIFL
jgi:hypothetical protein